MKIILKASAIFLSISLLLQFPVLAQDGTDSYPIFLPLVSNEKNINSYIGPDGGYVVSMVTNPKNSLIMYAATWGNGVFKSVDGGKSWNKFSNGLGDLLINSLAIDPQNPNILYAGTYNDEIYKSTNAGESWFHSSNGIQDYSVVYTIGIDPYNPDIIYIGTRGKNAIDPPPWNGIVYLSKNEGISWEPILEDVGGENQQDWAYDIVVNPKDHCMVFVAMHEFGVYRSLNCGDSWTSMNGNGLTDYSGRALAINPDGSSGDALYYATWHRTGVYKSTNNGNSWINQFLYSKIYSMDLDPKQPEIIYLADFYEGVLKTNNAGNTWTNIGLSENLMYSVMVNPGLHTQIFAGTAGNGIFRNDQNGSGWVHSQNGLNNSMVTDIRIHPTISGYLYTSVSRAGFYFSTDDGVSWQQLNQGLTDLDATGIVLHPQNPDRIYLLTGSGGLFSCTLPDCSWTTKNAGLPTISADIYLVMGFTPKNELETEIVFSGQQVDEVETKGVSYQTLNDLDFSLSHPDNVYLATNGDGVYRSQNGTESWVRVGLSGMNIQRIAVHPANPLVVYASPSNSDTVYTTTNAGSSWSPSKVPGGMINDLTVSNLEPGVLFVATNAGLYKRVDGGSWELAGLAGKQVTAFSVHPGQNNIMAAACGSELYYSKDAGQNWFSGTNEPLSTSIKRVSFDPSKTDIVYVGTNTQGNYRLKIK